MSISMCRLATTRDSATNAIVSQNDAAICKIRTPATKLVVNVEMAGTPVALRSKERERMFPLSLRVRVDGPLLLAHRGRRILFILWNSSLKTGFPVGVEFACRHRSVRSGFHQPRCLCYLALFRSAYSGSFRFCSHHSSLKRGYSVEVEFECRRRSARSGFHRQIVPRPAQNSLPSRPLLETPI